MSQKEHSTLHVILGNESCDLDSVVSSFAYALFLSVKNKSLGTEVDYIPVLNVSRNDLSLKTEVKYIFNKFSIPEKHFICRDEIDLAHWNKTGNLKLTLVDHNNLPLHDQGLESSVVEVIDHHKKEREDDKKVDLTIKAVGSCCTLIADKILNEEPKILEDLTITQLLISTILLDTANLSLEAKRATSLDIEVVDKLELYCPEPIDRVKVFDELVAAKMDIKNLSLEQLLRKDMKTLHVRDTDVVISSVPILVKDLLANHDIVSKLDVFSKLYKAHGLVIMGMLITEGEVKRDLAVFGQVPKIQSLISEGLCFAQDPCLALVRMNNSPQGIDVFHQNNVIASRKVILPLVKAILECNISNKNPECAISSNNDISEGCLSEPVSRGSSVSEAHFDDLSPSPTPSPNLLRIPVPNGLHPSTALQVSQFLGVGDPFSHGGSSQSSAYNSCPYTPINSYADDGNLPADMVNLPSFNSRDMIEKIETKRGKLRGYDGGDIHDPGSYPYTPVNSFVDCQMDQLYQKNLSHFANDIDTETILQRVKEKKVKANLFDPVDESDEPVLRLSKCLDHITVSEVDKTLPPERAGEVIQ